MPNHERRVNQRIATDFKVSYIHDGDYLISYTKDISVDGMFIYTESPPGISERPQLTFMLGGKEITLAAEVIWINDSKSSEDAGMGVRFINPPEKVKKAILRLVNKVAIFESQA